MSSKYRCFKLSNPIHIFGIVLIINPWYHSNSKTVIIKHCWLHNDIYITGKIAKQFFEATQLICVFKIDIMISGNNIHSNTGIAQRLKKMLTISIECFKVDEFSV